MLAVMPMAGLIFGGLSLAGAALCLVLFLYVRCEKRIFGHFDVVISRINYLFDQSSKFEDIDHFSKKKSNTVTPAFVKSEKVDMSIDMRSKTLR